MAQVPAVKLKPEKETDPPQPHAQEGEQLEDGLLGQECQQVGAQDKTQE
jgi:hypothetical protein